MGVVTFNDSVTSSLPAPKLFQVFFVDPAKYIPKAAPQFIKSFELLEGSIGAPGSIWKVNFGEGVPFPYAKTRVDVLDKDNLIFGDTIIEGGELSEKIQSVKREMKIESTPEGGSIHKTTIKVHVKEGEELSEEELKPAKEGAHGLFRAVESYILANPDA